MSRVNRGKRVMDLLLCVSGVVLLSPLFLGIAVAIKADDGGPVFFRQTRVGQGGRHFLLWKFRTMMEEAGAAGMQLTVGRDPRITRVGGFLRRWKLDELPQLLNVIAGDMSLVGPRPEVPRYVEHYSPEQREVLNYRPGVTDPASVRFRAESELLGGAADVERYYVQHVMPEKLRINMEYARSATVWTDLGVVVSTVGVLLAQALASRGASS